MKEEKKSESDTDLTAAQETLQQLWEEHVRHEFSTHNTDDTLATMVEDAYVNHIPVLTVGVGKDELREFYSKRFIPQMPPDTEMIPISRTIGTDQIVDEMIFKFTHTIRMDWMLPVTGGESARKALDKRLPSNALIDRADERVGR